MIILSQYLVYILLAGLVDSVLGGRRLMGRFLGPDRIAYNAIAALSVKLDKTERSEIDRILRGTFVTAVMIAVAGVLGSFFDYAVINSSWGDFIAVMILALIMGQRAVFQLVNHIVKLLSDPELDRERHRYGAARWAVERLVLRISDGLVANSLFIIIGALTPIGPLAMLVMFRALSVTISVGAPSGLEGPVSPYFKLPTMVFSLLTWVPARITGLLLTLALLFVPGGSIDGIKGLFLSRSLQNSWPLLRARAVPMACVAFGFNLCFKIVPEGGGRENWIGPEGSKARITADDLKRLLMTGMIAGLIMIAVICAGLLIIMV